MSVRHVDYNHFVFILRHDGLQMIAWLLANANNTVRMIITVTMVFSRRLPLRTPRAAARGSGAKSRCSVLSMSTAHVHTRQCTSTCMSMQLPINMVTSRLLICLVSVTMLTGSKLCSYVFATRLRMITLTHSVLAHFSLYSLQLCPSCLGN